MFGTITTCGSEQQRRQLCNVMQNKGRCKRGNNWKKINRNEIQTEKTCRERNQKKKNNYKKKLLLPNGTVLGRWCANVEGSLLEGMEGAQGWVAAWVPCSAAEWQQERGLRLPGVLQGSRGNHGRSTLLQL